MPRIREDANAQMIVLEAVFFAIMILLSLILISNIAPSPQSTINRYSNQLKILSDDSIRLLDNTPTDIKFEDRAPPFYNSRLVQYIALNDTQNASYFFNASLPDDVGYNIYVSNVQEEILWYNGEKFLGGKIGEVSRAKYPVVILYEKWVEMLGIYSNGIIPGYTDNEYTIILEAWNIL